MVKNKILFLKLGPKFNPVSSVRFWISNGNRTATDEQSKLRRQVENVSYMIVILK